MHCCDAMTRHTGRMCDEHDDPFECADYVIVYSPEDNEYGLIIHDGGQSSYQIAYCPSAERSYPKATAPD